MIFHLRVFEFFASMRDAKNFVSQPTEASTGYMNFHWSLGKWTICTCLEVL